MTVYNQRAHHAFAISVTFDALAAVFIVGRCVARFGVVRTCGADDVLILFAVAASVTFTVLIQVQSEFGLGQHVDSLSPTEQVDGLRPFWASVIIYYVALTLIKSSILCQFQRFFVGPTVRRLCWALLALVVAYGICTIVGQIFACTPVSFFWDKEIPNGQCINLLAFWFSNATFNIISDIMIVALPMPILKSLHLPKKQKYTLILLFAVGGIGCLTSIIRLYSLYIVAHSSDFTWNNVGAATWSSVELNVGIICACLPTLKPLFPKLLPSRQRNPLPARIERHVQYSVHSDGEGGYDLTNGRAQSPLPSPRMIEGDEDKVHLRPEKDDNWANSQHCEVKSERDSDRAWQTNTYVATVEVN